MKATARTIVEWTVQWTVDTNWKVVPVPDTTLLTKTTGSPWSSRVNTVNRYNYNYV